MGKELATSNDPNSLLTTADRQAMSARKRLNKAARQEALRDELSARAYINNLVRIDKDLRKLGQEAYNQRKRMGKSEASAHMIKVATLKERAAINFRLLNKVLPDLKGIELSDPQGNSPFAGLADLFKKAVQDTSELENAGSE